MKAIALSQYLPIDNPLSLQDIELPTPVATGRDILVKVEAISVNPVDAKIRAPKDEAITEPRVLGWDVAGTVVAVGPEVSLFAVGDAVYYAGSVTRPGANSEYHLVDERIVGHKPASLNFSQAAALPLTTITAWEALFDRLAISSTGADAGKRILIIGGAGGVGSIAIQLAKKLAKLEVVATASRDISSKWCKDLGADHVINHNGNMQEQLAKLNLTQIDYIFCVSDTDPHFDAMADIIAPQGKICSIVGSVAPLEMSKLFAKSVTFVWEMMFSRAMFLTADMQKQHDLLEASAALIDSGVLKTTLGEVFGKINAENLRRAHAAIEGQRTIGKIVLAGF
jgi:NADPH2:quinone reductase